MTTDLANVSVHHERYDGGGILLIGWLLLLSGIAAMIWAGVNQPTFTNRDFDEVYNIGLVYNHLLVMIAGGVGVLLGATAIATVHIRRTLT